MMKKRSGTVLQPPKPNSLAPATATGAAAAEISPTAPTPAPPQTSPSSSPSASPLPPQQASSTNSNSKLDNRISRFFHFGNNRTASIDDFSAFSGGIFTDAPEEEEETVVFNELYQLDPKSLTETIVINRLYDEKKVG